MFLFPPFINSFHHVPLFPQFLHSHSQLSSKFTLFNFNMKNNTLIDHEHYHHSSRFLHNPSFSSTLLDQIYRSIDQSEQHNYTNTPNHMKTFFTQTTSRTEKNKKQEPSTRSTSRDYDNDVTCFSSTSLSSDSSSSSSSSAGFSSSDTESTRPSRTRSSSSCFLPLRPVKTSASLRDEEKGDDDRRKFHSFRHDFKTELGALIGGDRGEDDYESLSMKSKSRALKIYNNLKKVKQPISPGAKITSFLNSIFATSKKTKSTNHDIKNIYQNRLHESNDASKNVDNDAKKSKSIQTSLPSTCSFSRSCLSKTGRLHRSNDIPEEEREAKLVQTSTHSSLSSSKSCLSKSLTSEREKLRNGTKRTVRFYPVSVIVGEEGINNKVATKTWKNSSNVEKSKVVKEAAREFLEEYHKNKNKNNLVSEALMDLHKNNNNKINNANHDEDDDDDDVASCASSDLFELDHLAELPVYETTHVCTNRAIANGLAV
ncbi:protein BIG GRAIN 1-like B [Arachis ipaensis]|uniref:protein BIG GRAIN 1-like B n=1 Tax=Arachis ipaensis TaxID=130454 RepID=UPI0007AF82B1|nr:protein BIG GRAIN 1-like B [Arachis ipaensis]